MSQSRLNLTQQRQIIEKLKQMQRMSQEIKLLQRMSNKSGVIYYETSSSLEYDLAIPIPYESGLLNGVVEIDTIFTAARQQWPFAKSIPKVYLGSVDEANLLAPSTYDDSLNVNFLETPYDLHFSQRFSYGAPPADTTVYVKCFFYATDKGSFTVTGAKL